MRDEFVAIETDPISLDYLAIAKAVEPVDRISPIAGKENDALMVRWRRFEFRLNPRDGPELDPGLTNVPVASVAG